MPVPRVVRFVWQAFERGVVGFVVGLGLLRVHKYRQRDAGRALAAGVGRVNSAGRAIHKLVRWDKSTPRDTHPYQLS